MRAFAGLPFEKKADRMSDCIRVMNVLGCGSPRGIIPEGADPGDPLGPVSGHTPVGELDSSSAASRHRWQSDCRFVDVAYLTGDPEWRENSTARDRGVVA